MTESKGELVFRPEHKVNYRFQLMITILLVVLVYFFLRLDSVEAQTKTVFLVVNNLKTTHFSAQATVGEFLDETYPTEVVSVFPARDSQLTANTTIYITAQPIAITQVVADNLSDAVKEAEKAEEPAELEVAMVSNPEPKSHTYNGTATWYRWGDKLTTASTQFPRGTKLRVIAVNSGKHVDVVVNDYGPEAWTSVALDLNSVAFSRLAPLGAGKIQIKYYKI